MINGSPKAKKDNNSQYFIDQLSSLLSKSDIEVKQISHFQYCSKDVYPQLLDSEVIIFVSPLYVDSLPSSLLSFMVGLESYIKNTMPIISTSPKVYSILNCGFFEGHQNRISMDTFRNFCHKVGFTWRFGIGIGAGEFMDETKDSIPLNSRIKIDTFNALMELKDDIESDNTTSKNNIFTSPKMPRFIFKLAGNLSWIRQVKSNKLKIRDLYARPHVK